MLAWIAWTGLALIALVLSAGLLLLATPLRLEARLSLPSQTPVVARLQLLGGLVPWIDLSRIGSKPPEEKEPGRKRGTGWTVSGTHAGRMARAAPRLLVSLFAAIRFETGRVDVDFGFEDPADTGEAFGQLAPILYGAGPTLPVDLALRPHFNGAILAGQAEGRLRVIPLSFVPPLILFAWRVWGPRL